MGIMVDGSSRFARHGLVGLLLVLILLTAQVTDVVALVERYVAPTSAFTVNVNAQLAGAIADNYLVHLSAGVYTGCGPATIDLNPGSALSVTLIGAGEAETTIDCENVVLTTSPVFTCGTGCTALLQNVTVTKVRMTIASPDNVGALVNASGGASLTFHSVNVTSCTAVTNGGASLPIDLTAASSIVRVSGSGTRLVVVDSTFSLNTAEIGSISAVNDAQVSVSRSHFEFNAGGGGHPSQGFGGVFSFAHGAICHVSQSSFLSNFAIRSGGIVYSFYGGGVSFDNVTTQDSSALYAGGGVVYSQFGGDVSFVAVTTQDSSSGSYGGVVCVFDGGDLTFVNVTTRKSHADESGGVVFTRRSGDVSFADVATRDSSASESGGGVVCSEQGGDVSFVDVTTQDSNAGGDGGGVVLLYSGGEVNFVNVTTQDSSSDGLGGVVFSYISGNVSFVSVTAQDSSAKGFGGVLCVDDGGDVSFVNVTTQDSTSGSHGGVVYSAYCGNVCFVDVTTLDSKADGAGGVVYSNSARDVSFAHVTTQNSSAGSFGGVLYFGYGGDVSFVDVTTQNSSAGTFGGVYYSQRSGDVSFVDVTTQDSSASVHGGVMSVPNAVVILINVTAHDSTALSGGSLFFLQSSQLVAQDLTVVSIYSDIIHAGRANELQPPSAVLLQRSSLSCTGFVSCMVLEGPSVLNASECVFFVESGVGIQALEASSLYMSNCSLSGGAGAVFLSLSDCACAISESVLKVPVVGLAVFSLSSTLNVSQSALNASGSGLVLASISGSATLVLSQLACSSNAPVISAGTTWTIVSSVLVGALPLSFDRYAKLEDSFLGAVSVGAPALSCHAATYLASSVTCGGSGSLTVPSGTCSGGTTSLGAGQPNCHDACFNGSFCVPDELSGEGYFWFDSLGCPRCGGPCWLGTDNCNTTLAYCYDVPGGSFACECRTGFAGDGVQCEDIDECLLADACTAPRTVCLNTPGSYSCPCESGTSLFEGFLCRELDECQAQVHDCDVSAACINTPGSFACECMADTFGNGTSPCVSCPPLSGTEGQGSLELDDCLCAPNYYMSSTTCLACPANSTSAAGSTDATACFCEPYHYREADEPAESPCEVCPAGSFALSEHQCLPCPSGSFSLKVNATSCASCPASSSTNLQVGAVACTCFPNYNSSGSGEDLVCTQSCPPGWQTAGAACQLCGFGFYSRDVNSPRCTRCPPGTSTVRPNATSWSECECLPDRIDAGGGLQACPLNCSAGTSYVSGLDECLPCPRGSYWRLDSVAGMGSCAVCPVNSYTVAVGSTNVSACLCNDGFAYDEIRGWCAINCGPGFAVEATSCELCGPGTYSSAANSPTCSACPLNALTQPGATSRSECSCVPGFYSDKANGGECPACPTGAVCTGGSSPPTAVAGYYQGEGNFFAECTPATACVGANKCAQGYEGNLCSACSAGYYRVNGQCRGCGPGPQLALAVFVMALLFCSFLLLVCTSRQTGTSYLGVLKVFLPCLQALSLFGELPLSWPPYLARLFMATGATSFDMELIGVECFVGSVTNGGNGGGQDDGDPVGTFARRWAVYMALPLIGAGGLGLASLLIYLLDRLSIFNSLVKLEDSASSGAAASSSYVRRLAGVALRAYGLAIALIYLPLCAHVFSVYDCVHNGFGELVLFTDPSVHCESSTSYSSLRNLAVFFTVLYVAGIPLLLISSLFYLRRRHENDVAFYKAVGGLATSYRRAMFAFEGVLLVRKLALAVALSSFFGAPRLRLVGCLAVILLSSMSSLFLRPYSKATHNLVEMGALGGLSAILSVGIMTGSAESRPQNLGVGVALFVLVVAYLLGFVAAWVWDVRRQILDGKCKSALSTVDGASPRAGNGVERSGGALSLVDSTYAATASREPTVGGGGEGQGHGSSDGFEHGRGVSRGRDMPSDLASVVRGTDGVDAHGGEGGPVRTFSQTETWQEEGPAGDWASPAEEDLETRRGAGAPAARGGLGRGGALSNQKTTMGWEGPRGAGDGGSLPSDLQSYQNDDAKAVASDWQLLRNPHLDLQSVQRGR